MISQCLVAVSLLKKGTTPEKADRRIETGGICPHSGRYRIVLHLATRGFGGLLRAKPVAKIGQKRHDIASKWLVSGRKLMPENHKYMKLHYACHGAAKWKIGEIGLGALKTSKYLKTNSIFGISASKSSRYMNNIGSSK